MCPTDKTAFVSHIVLCFAGHDLNFLDAKTYIVHTLTFLIADYTLKLMDAFNMALFFFLTCYLIKLMLAFIVGSILDQEKKGSGILVIYSCITLKTNIYYVPWFLWVRNSLRA